MCVCRLHEQLGQMSEAANYYERYVTQTESQGVSCDVRVDGLALYTLEHGHYCHCSNR